MNIIEWFQYQYHNIGFRLAMDRLASLDRLARGEFPDVIPAQTRYRPQIDVAVAQAQRHLASMDLLTTMERLEGELS